MKKIGYSQRKFTAYPKNKFLFLLEVGVNIGLGHYTRCNNLAKHLIICGYECQVIIFNHGLILDYVILDYTYIKIVNVFGDITNFVKQELELGVSYDKIILDFITVKQCFIDLILSRIPNQKLIFIDDYKFFNYHGVTILDWSLDANINHHHHNQDQNNCLLGIKYLVLNPLINEVKPLAHREDIITFCFGGTNVRNCSQKIYQSIVQYFPGFKFVFINQNKFVDHENCSFSGFLQPLDIYKLFSRSKLVICGLGQMVYELAYLESPFIPVINTRISSKELTALKENMFFHEELTLDSINIANIVLDKINNTYPKYAKNIMQYNPQNLINEITKIHNDSNCRRNQC